MLSSDQRLKHWKIIIVRKVHLDVKVYPARVENIDIIMKYQFVYSLSSVTVFNLEHNLWQHHRTSAGFVVDKVFKVYKYTQ